MAQRPRATENVVPLFGADDAYEVEDVAWGRSILPAAPAAPPVGSVPDLNGKPKILMAIGAGHSGKTTLLKWCVEQILERESTAKLVAIDPENRDLKNFFQNVYEPVDSDPAGVAIFLKGFFDALVRDQSSGLIDTGGGDTVIGRIVSEMPTIVADLSDAGITMVVAYMFSPRLADLSALATMEGAGFHPTTALILNEGRVEVGQDPDQAFALLRRQSAYRAALDRGAIELRMPRLPVAKKVEDRRLQFRQAAQGKIPEGRKVAPLGWSDRVSLKAWLARMDDAMAPIVKAGWLP
jgi:hypothetical protein